jgi:hypothetical protein
MTKELEDLMAVNHKALQLAAPSTSGSRHDR